MMEITYSGMCLAAIFGSILYEHRRLKKEESQLRETLRRLADQARHETGAELEAKEALPEAPARETIKTISC